MTITYLQYLIFGLALIVATGVFTVLALMGFGNDGIGAESIAIGTGGIGIACALVGVLGCLGWIA